MSNRIFSRAKYCLIIAIMALMMACNGSQTVKPTKEEVQAYRDSLVYPGAPEEPRYRFDLSLVNSAQLAPKNEESKWRELLTGESTVAGEGLSKPFDVASCKGRVYVTDTVKRHVAVFDFANKKYFAIGEEEPGMLAKPMGINSDANCNIYVADASSRKIMIYNAEGQFLREIGKKDDFSRLSHVAVSKDGQRVFAVDTGGVQSDNHKVLVFDSLTGERLFDIGSRGTQEGQLNIPRDADVGPDGNLYIVDGGNFRVQVFTPDGEFLRTFGSVGSRHGQFSRPKGIAIDPDGLIYVSDAAFGNFQIFTADGQLLMAVGQRSNNFGPAQYILPAGIDVDEDGRIFFVGQFFHKVDIFRPAMMPENYGHIGKLIEQIRKDE